MKNINYTEIFNCRSCGGNELTSVLDLGEMFISDFIDKKNDNEIFKAPLELVLCKHCSLLQLKHSVDNSLLYRNYWYRSGVNQTMTDELEDIVRNIENSIHLSDHDFVIDIGANDGTLLRSYKNKNLNKIGFEPALNLRKYNLEGTTKIISNFFNFNDWKKNFDNKKAKAISAIGMFYDLENPNEFLKDVYNCLDDNGIFIIQMMYLPLFIERNAFDGICHEHLEYYSIESLNNLLNRNNFEIFGMEIKDKVNEGSARYYIKKKNSILDKKINKKIIRELKFQKNLESKIDLTNINTYKLLKERIISSKNKTINFLKTERKKGKKIHGYAASTKGNTTLQFYEIDTSMISAISDRNPDKWGKITAGSFIPVISEEESRNNKPDYYFILAWHFLEEFLKREKKFFESGGKFIVSMPNFKIIDGAQSKDF